MLSPTRATASKRSKHSPNKHDVEASCEFEEVSFQTPKRPNAGKVTAPRVMSPAAKIATLTVIENGSARTVLALAALIHASIVLGATTVTHERPQIVYDLLASLIPTASLFITKALPNKIVSKWHQAISASMFSVIAISFVMQSLVAYKSLLKERSYDFTCFAVTIAFTMFCRASQLSFIYASLTGGATFVTVISAAAYLDVFQGSMNRDSILTDGVTLLMAAGIGYSVWLSYRRSVPYPLPTRTRSPAVTSTPSLPKGGSPSLSVAVCPPTQPRVTFTPAPFTTHFNDPMELALSAQVQSSPAGDLPTAVPDTQPQVVVASSMVATSLRKPVGSSPLPEDYQPPAAHSIPEAQDPLFMSTVGIVVDNLTERREQSLEHPPFQDNVVIGPLSLDSHDTEPEDVVTNSQAALTVNTSDTAHSLRPWRSASVTASLSARSFGSTDSQASIDSQDSTASSDTESKSKKTRKLLLTSLAERGYPTELLPSKLRQTEKLRSILHSFKQDVSANGLEAARKHAWELHNTRKSAARATGSENVAENVPGGKKVAETVMSLVDVHQQLAPFKPLGIATSTNAPRKVALIRSHTSTVGL